jgi:hypothetical protein
MGSPRTAIAWFGFSLAVKLGVYCVAFGDADPPVNAPKGM